MLTDALPRKSRSQFAESDRIKTLELPQDRQLLMIAKSIDSAMQARVAADVRRACTEFLAVASEFYKVPTCGIRVLAARPLRIREHSATELFGDYNPETMLIRVWMRTAVRKEITSYGTFLSMLCHEFCHHLDFQRFGFPASWHTALGLAHSQADRHEWRFASECSFARNRPQDDGRRCKESAGMARRSLSKVRPSSTSAARSSGIALDAIEGKRAICNCNQWNARKRSTFT